MIAATRQVVVADHEVLVEAPEEVVLGHRWDSHRARVAFQPRSTTALVSIGLDEEHRLVQQAILGIGGLNLRVATMRHHECVMVLDDADLPLLMTKLDFLTNRSFPKVGDRDDAFEATLLEADALIDRLLPRPGPLAWLALNTPRSSRARSRAGAESSTTRIKAPSRSAKYYGVLPVGMPTRAKTFARVRWER